MIHLVHRPSYTPSREVDLCLFVAYFRETNTHGGTKYVDSAVIDRSRFRMKETSFRKVVPFKTTLTPLILIFSSNVLKSL